MTLPKMALAHMGITVKNLAVMEAFYTEVLGFRASDRGVARGSPLVFLTRDPSDHHQIVFQEQRKSDETTINQISFQLDDLAALRRMRDVLVKARVKELKLVDHCVAWSVYCHDPEGNRLEFFVDAPFYVKQPMIQELNLDQSDGDVIEATKKRFSTDPSFCSLGEWRKSFARTFEQAPREETGRPVLLVGSIPCRDSEEVFRLLSTELGALAARYPDGETGNRIHWIRWQRHVFDDNPDMRLVEAKNHPGYQDNPQLRPYYALKAGADLGGFAFKELGYAAEAIKSYGVFSKLKNDGKIPSSVKFQVSLPTAVSLLTSFVINEDRGRVELALEAAMKAEVERMIAAIPAHDLAIQWDVASEVIGHDGGRELHFSDTLTGSVERIVRHVEFVPDGVEAGIHLCYGDPGHKHVVEPTDTGTCVAFTNAICAKSPRPIDWVHIPIPRGWDQAAYYKPLADLRAGAETEVYLGLVHFTDGLDGTKRRLALAGEHLAGFGIATECGFGRRDPTTIRQLLEIHRQIASAGLHASH